MYKVISQIVALSLSISLSGASPIATTPKPAHVLAKRTNQCGDSTFNPSTQSAAFYGGAAINDCQQLIANIQGDGSWGVDPTLYFQAIASFGSCTFWAGSRSSAPPTIGNQDIIDIVGSVIAQNQWGLTDYPNDPPVITVGSGTMPCQQQGIDGDGQPAVVDWFVGKIVG